MILYSQLIQHTTVIHQYAQCKVRYDSALTHYEFSVIEEVVSVVNGERGIILLLLLFFSILRSDGREDVEENRDGTERRREKVNEEKERKRIERWLREEEKVEERR